MAVSSGRDERGQGRGEEEMVDDGWVGREMGKQRWRRREEEYGWVVAARLSHVEDDHLGALTSRQLFTRLSVHNAQVCVVVSRAVYGGLLCGVVCGVIVVWYVVDRKSVV